jgi:hypothetical protein
MRIVNCRTLNSWIHDLLFERGIAYRLAGALSALLLGQPWEYTRMLRERTPREARKTGGLVLQGRSLA